MRLQHGFSLVKLCWHCWREKPQRPAVAVTTSGGIRDKTLVNESGRRRLMHLCNDCCSCEICGQQKLLTSRGESLLQRVAHVRGTGSRSRDLWALDLVTAATVAVPPSTRLSVFTPNL